MTRNAFALAIALLVGPSVATTPGQKSAPGQDTAASSGRFELTVDSIMRGPDLVGYPPTGLRRSADSKKLFFDWRKPGEPEPSTHVVGRELRKLPDSEVKASPAADGRWDKAHRRVLFVDGGDVVLVDSARGIRRQITRTTGAESNPRWSRSDTDVTDVRDGNVFVVPLDSSAGGIVTQLTDVGPKKTDPRRTDSQKRLFTPEMIGSKRDPTHPGVVFVHGAGYAYPVENHGFTEASSWADEYKRILKLFEDNLRTPHNGKAT